MTFQAGSSCTYSDIGYTRFCSFRASKRRSPKLSGRSLSLTNFSTAGSAHPRSLPEPTQSCTVVLPAACFARVQEISLIPRQRLLDWHRSETSEARLLACICCMRTCSLLHDTALRLHKPPDLWLSTDGRLSHRCAANCACWPRLCHRRSARQSCKRLCEGSTGILSTRWHNSFTARENRGSKLGRGQDVSAKNMQPHLLLLVDSMQSAPAQLAKPTSALPMDSESQSDAQA